MARWCYRHRLVVLLLWVGVLFGLGTAGSAAGTDYANVFSLPDTDSKRAIDLMQKAFPESAGDTDTVVWKVDDGSVREESVRSRIEPALEDIAAMKGVGEVRSPYAEGPAGAAQISENGRIAYAQVTFTEQANSVPKGLVEDVVDTAQDAERDGLQVELGGQAITRIQEPPTGVAEMVGIIAAAIILFLAFGSVFAMVLPIVVALFGVGTGMLSTMLISHVTDVADVAPILGSLIGLGVGIDYALFIITRHRRGILRGADPEDAAVQALNTSGRAVLFAGGTVVIALAGMLVMNMRFLDGVVIGTSLTVVLSVLAAVTLLPALLGLLGMRVLSRRQRRRLAEHGPEPENASGLAARWSSYVQKRPRSIALAAVVVMAVLALPVLSLRLGATDQGNHQESTTTRQAYDILAEGFGAGFNGPLQVVTEAPDTGALVERIRSTEGVAQVSAVPPSEGVSVIQVVPTTSPQSEATDQLIDRLRDHVIPESGVEAHVGGVTAVFKDFASVTGDRLPYFVAAIIGLGFLLLLIAFRSLVVPLTAALMNLIAAAASFGVLVAIFQWGWGTELLGVGKEGPITSFLPVIMLSLLFGLSMDYQVFLVSRMHEEWVHTRDNARAVRVGLAETSRVINCAALIMICVFSAFVLSGDMEGAMAGIGLAAAVALDAFILRTALVPAAMHLLGRSNWWLPAWLDKRLPHLAVEPREEAEPLPDTAAHARVPEPTAHARVPEAADEETNGVSAVAVVHGFIRTTDGEPVSGAVLTLLSRGGRQLDRVRSLADGSYILSAPFPGGYLLAASAPGFAPRARHVVVTEAPLVYDVELAPEGVDAVN
ncbi:MMPL family transporter [Streptomyces himalayensis]|uniref:MMPL family transporter n=1 Tax=Streptomyces himalayensis subsp. himalayensis TaxID=2756131 RepID=A0A7W0DPQ3_9ACTN|nr:MMPL family transporter [Streptomyces himalayensis]MBA2948931.1 MMPL family transporter [Streptomyces himalayensis subsp. himalayensis]